MNKPVCRLRALAAALALVLVLACPVLAAEETEPQESPAASEPTAAPTASAVPTRSDTVFLGQVSTWVEDTPECVHDYSAYATAEKTYATMVGNRLHLVVYSTVPPDAESDFYVAMDSHITYPDGSDRFALVGQGGGYYYYEKDIRVSQAGSFALTVANTNTTLYSGLYDTVSITAYDTIESLSFFVEQTPDDVAVTHFFITANGADTAIITPDTEGFNATDNEWKIVTAEKSERVLFEGTGYNGYTFSPQVTSLAITADAQAQAEPTSIQVYYLGLINGRLITVGPYTYPARTNIYSSVFELQTDQLEALTTEETLTFYAYIESGRMPELTVTDPAHVAHLEGVSQVPSDREGLDKWAVTVRVGDPSADLDLLIGNRWSVNQVAYNYRTLHVTFLRQITSLVVTATQTDHYNVTYTASVNGRQSLDTQTVNWYVNDRLQDEHGLTLEKHFDQGGRYTVYAQLGGQSSNQLTTEIIYANYQAVFWYVLAAVVLTALVLAMRRRWREAGARRDTRIHAEIEQLLAQTERWQVQLTQGRRRPIEARRQLRRLARRLDKVSDSLSERHRASNIAAYKNAAQELMTAGDVARRAVKKRASDPYYLRAVLDSTRRGLSAALEDMNEVGALLLR